MASFTDTISWLKLVRFVGNWHFKILSLNLPLKVNTVADSLSCNTVPILSIQKPPNVEAKQRQNIDIWPRISRNAVGGTWQSCSNNFPSAWFSKHIVQAYCRSLPGKEVRQGLAVCWQEILLNLRVTGTHVQLWISTRSGADLYNLSHVTPRCIRVLVK